MNQFCHNCGKQVLLGSNFCASCGTNLKSLTSKPEPIKAQASFVPFNPRDDDDEDAIDNIVKLDVKISKLELDIRGQATQSETLASVMSQSAPLPPQDKRNEAPAINEKEFMNEFQREAGTLRNEK